MTTTSEKAAAALELLPEEGLDDVKAGRVAEWDSLHSCAEPATSKPDARLDEGRPI